GVACAQHHFVGTGGLGDHLDARERLVQPAQSCTHQRVIVADQYSKQRQPLCSNPDTIAAPGAARMSWPELVTAVAEFTVSGGGFRPPRGGGSGTGGAPARPPGPAAWGRSAASTARPRRWSGGRARWPAAAGSRAASRPGA